MPYYKCNCGYEVGTLERIYPQCRRCNKTMLWLDRPRFIYRCSDCKRTLESDEGVPFTQRSCSAYGIKCPGKMIFINYYDKQHYPYIDGIDYYCLECGNEITEPRFNHYECYYCSGDAEYDQAVNYAPQLAAKEGVSLEEYCKRFGINPNSF